MAKEVFSEMSDEELMKVLEEYECECGEDFWQDGEVTGSFEEEAQSLMDFWRSWDAERQQSYYDYKIKEYHERVLAK